MAQIIGVGYQGTKDYQKSEIAIARAKLKALGALGGLDSLQIAQQEADRRGGVIIKIKGEMGYRGRQVYHIVSPASAWEGGGGGGAGGAGAGAGGTSGGMPGQIAANASIKQFTGGGFQGVGATNIQGAGVAVVGEFLGVNFQTADTKLSEGTSPNALNVDGMTRAGVLSPRPMLIAMHPKRNDSAPSEVPATYFGRSIDMLSPAMNQSLHMTVILGYDKSSNIGTSLASTVKVYAKKMKPLWHAQKDISHIKPRVVLTDSTVSGGIVFNVAMPLGFRKNSPVVASVDQMIVRRSRLTYPQDRDGRDDTSSSIVATKDYATWDGTSTVVTDASVVSTGVTFYYSMWGIGKVHASDRASLRVVGK